MKTRNFKKLTLADGKTIAKRYSYALSTIKEFFKNEDLKLHLCYYSGRGNFIHKHDSKYREMIEMLNILGVSFFQGNDAPRGGFVGNFILIKKKDVRQIIKFLDEKTNAVYNKLCNSSILSNYLLK